MLENFFGKPFSDRHYGAPLLPGLLKVLRAKPACHAINRDRPSQMS